MRLEFSASWSALVFAGVLLISLIGGARDLFQQPAGAARVGRIPPRAEGSCALASDGPFGKFDKRQLQRGFQVYTEVCSACHSLKLVAFRDLAGARLQRGRDQEDRVRLEDPGAVDQPGHRRAGDAQGAAVRHFPDARSPNEIAARAANNNALPPDLSLITKAREGGAAYVYSLLTGYQNQPAETAQEVPGRQDAAEPALQSLFREPQHRHAAAADQRWPGDLRGRQSKPTVDQMAKDVAAFLVWTAEPNLESRHAAGLAVAIFLLFATILGYLAYQQIWHEAKRAVRRDRRARPENQAKSRRAKAKAGRRRLSYSTPCEFAFTPEERRSPLDRSAADPRFRQV